MRNIVLVGLTLLILSGLALAHQSGEQETGTSMHDMMQRMMKGEKTGERGMEMMGMMGRMSKMMDQCSAMMESKGTKQDQKK